MVIFKCSLIMPKFMLKPETGEEGAIVSTVINTSVLVFPTVVMEEKALI